MLNQVDSDTKLYEHENGTDRLEDFGLRNWFSFLLEKDIDVTLKK